MITTVRVLSYVSFVGLKVGTYPETVFDTIGLSHDKSLTWTI